MNNQQLLNAIEAVVKQAKLSLNTQSTLGTLDGTTAIDMEILVSPWTVPDPKNPINFVVGDMRSKDNQVWKCIQPYRDVDHPNVIPGETPSMWVPYHTKDPRKAKPFIQPTFNEDSYFKDECCMLNGVIYRSIMDTANPYSPEAYSTGWEIVTL